MFGVEVKYKDNQRGFSRGVFLYTVRTELVRFPKNVEGDAILGELVETRCFLRENSSELLPPWEIIHFSDIVWETDDWRGEL